MNHYLVDMRRTLVFLLFPMSLQAYAQFEALPMANATWATSFWVGPGYPYEGYYHAFDQDSPDTLFAGQVFKKLTVRFSSGGYVYPGSGYGGALRDNGLGQVFYWEPWAAEPQLLYDFDVLPGDTVFDAYFGLALVHSVDTFMVNALPRKRIGLACVDQQEWASEHWIQGVGGTGGFFYSSLCGSVSGIGVLACMSVNDTLQYGGAGFGDCEMILSVGEQTHGTRTWAVPNPSNGRFTLVAGGARVERCAIFDARGTWVKDEVGAIVDLSGLRPGVYMAQAITSSGISTALLMLQ
jgi:hypothetical protein